MKPALIWILRGVVALAGGAGLFLLFAPPQPAGLPTTLSQVPVPVETPARRSVQESPIRTTPAKVEPAAVGQQQPSARAAAAVLSPVPRRLRPPQLVEGRGKAAEMKLAGQQGTLKYDGGVALLIRCEDYGAAWGPLRTSPQVWNSWRAMLEQQGFAVEEMHNPTGEEIRRRIESFGLDYAPRAGENFRYLVYFSGLSYSLPSSDGKLDDFLVGVDAAHPDKDEAGFRQSSIRVDRLESMASEFLHSRHALFIINAPVVMDFLAHSILREGADPSPAGGQVRHFIGASERADLWSPSQSDRFLTNLMDGLEGSADKDADTFVTGTELGEWCVALHLRAGVEYPLKSYHGKLANTDAEMAFTTSRTGPAAGLAALAGSSDPQGSRAMPAISEQPLSETVGLPTIPKIGEPYDLDGTMLRMLWVPPGEHSVVDATTGETAIPSKQLEGFWMAETEVWQGLWDQSVMSAGPPHGTRVLARLPARNVSWDAAVAWCVMFTERERAAGRLPEGYLYRLPTELEWEHVSVRAGKAYRRPGPAYGFDESLPLAEIRQTRSQGASFVGLLDGVREWCHEPASSAMSTTVPPQPLHRVVRGDIQNDDLARQSSRFSHYLAANAYPEVGFRPVLAREAVLPEKLYGASDSQALAMHAPAAVPPPARLPEGAFYKADEVFVDMYKDYDEKSKSAIYKQVQTKLLGEPDAVYKGKADGSPGPGTQLAIYVYQEKHALPVTGQLDTATLTQMGLVNLPKVVSSGDSGRSSSGGFPYWITHPPPKGRYAKRGGTVVNKTLDFFSKDGVDAKEESKEAAFEKWEERKEAWEDANGRKVPNSMIKWR